MFEVFKTPFRNILDIKNYYLPIICLLFAKYLPNIAVYLEIQQQIQGTNLPFHFNQGNQSRQRCYKIKQRFDGAPV